jgi:hypothetical protein
MFTHVTSYYILVSIHGRRELYQGPRPEGKHFKIRLNFPFPPPELCPRMIVKTLKNISVNVSSHEYAFLENINYSFPAINDLHDRQDKVSICLEFGSRGDLGLYLPSICADGKHLLVKYIYFLTAELYQENLDHRH